LSVLILNDALTKAALAHSIDMEDNNYFDHMINHNKKSQENNYSVVL
jgi:uncharacterized protein YkwD